MSEPVICDEAEVVGKAFKPKKKYFQEGGKWRRQRERDSPTS